METGNATVAGIGTVGLPPAFEELREFIERTGLCRDAYELVFALVVAGYEISKPA